MLNEKLKQKILNTLTNQPKPIKQIAQEVGKKYTGILSYIHELVLSGQIQLTHISGVKCYSLPEEQVTEVISE